MAYKVHTGWDRAEDQTMVVVCRMKLDEPYQRLYEGLKAFIPVSRLIADPLRTLAYGTDASFYRLIPKLVVEVVDENEVVGCLKLVHRHGTPVTFRAAGTSLSGQAITDAVLLRLAGNAWQDCRIDEDATKIHLQPGIVGSRANRYLAPFQRKIGPDPASINAAKIGGIAANNASGMCCGTAQNSYQTLAGMRVIFADGAILDTREPASCSDFEASHGNMLQDISTLSRRVKENPTLAQRIRHKYRLKNTTGYGLNALLDFDDPIDIIQHLMIGSEGTLGFIAEISYRTVPEHPHKATALLLFPDIETACRAVVALKTTPVAAVELMDRASLRSVQDKTGVPAYLRELSEQASALLVDTRAKDLTGLQQQLEQIEGSLVGIEQLRPAAFTSDPLEYATLWNIRKGLFPAVGAVRETGTTVIIEDVAFPVSKLADVTRDLQTLFQRYGYHEAIIWGHALEGNLHFVVTQDLSLSAEVNRYQRLMEEVCALVVEKYDGSLKAEHGTGRNMAPYVEMEWGREAYQLMREIKGIFDPDNLLNPGVLLNDDPKVHLKNLKPMPAADPLIDKCIECGFCEVSCPSRNLTLTPRQRIVCYREMARLRSVGNDPARLAVFEETFRYQGMDTCAGDGMCATRCPVDIDTGKLIRKLRAAEWGVQGQRVAQGMADRFGALSGMIRTGLFCADGMHALLGTRLMEGLTGGLRRVSGDRLALWNRYMPKRTPCPTAPIRQPTGSDRVVYLPSCASRTMGPARGDPEQDPLPVKTVALLHKAGYQVIYPSGLDNLCCGRPFASKGLPDQAEHMARQLENALFAASEEGKYPVLCDTVPCVQTVLERMDQRLQLFDPVQFIYEKLRSRLVFHRRAGTVTLHITCSTSKLGLGDRLRELAEACAERVVVPEGIDCCGWAGDRGFSFPELNASALQGLRAQLPADCEAGYCNSRTCEIGASLHGEIHYRSIVYLVDHCSESALVE